ncbi:MAG: hypothetical protein LQ350_006765 [Teloschistes chrysophthalmus]|nr:MAG: hypothetical protein LQ350_006765 [Niorma chrysophthalma]
MESHDTHEPPHKRRRKAPRSASTYVFRPLLEDIALAPDDYPAKVHITCVELWEGNLYIGTSAAEILHYVALPADSADDTASPSYIFASRLQPTTTSTSSPSPGVQQVLVLPKVAKACVLCNGTLTFYSLPELSPAFGNTVVSGCSWIGGENLNASDGEDEAGQVVMICIKSRIRLVRIGDDARRIRNIEYPACLTLARRDNFACVADAQAYALLDVENQQKISLFPISSLDENAHGGQVEDISAKSDSSRPSSAVGDPKGHGRSRSLGAFVGGLGRRSPQSRSQERSGQDTAELGLRAASPLRLSHDQPRSDSGPGEVGRTLSVSDKPLPAPPDRSSSQKGGQTVAAPSSAQLIPHVCSPTPGEFLLTTGTTPEEPGVGIFVNLEGDVVRGTLQFDRYPTSVVVDGDVSYAAMSSSGMGKSEDIHVLASTIQNRDGGDREVIEVRKADADNDDGNEHLDVPFPFEENSTNEAGTIVGHARLRSLLSDTSASFAEVGDMLGLVRLRVPDHRAARMNQPEKSKGANEDREKEEKVFAQRLGSRSSRLVLWSGSSIWWLVRNPLVLRLDGAIDACIEAPLNSTQTLVHRGEILRIVSSVSEYEVETETDFLTLKYIRQKSGIILLANTLSRNPSSSGITPTELRALEDQLVESGLDPRIVLSMLPLLGEEIVEGSQGIWIHGGLTRVIEQYAHLSSSASGPSDGPFKHNEWSNLIKRYLAAWRQRKGFGSIADEAEVFQSVDAALLHLLLHQDDQHAPRAGIPQASCSELYSLVDTGVDCFERAVVLLEQYRRLYVLSRLYQSRKLAGKVLQTWRRIVEGEADAGDELRDGENEIRKYLAKIRDVTLIQEYGTWLACRNPALGVQVFAEDSSRVKFVPQEVVRLLKDQAPDAVKVYLEHLVFGKKKGQYANDLITYYLDSVLNVLEASDEARSILARSYESYRALQTPKPTYRQFIMDNAVSATWWQDRLRLLELLGGSHGADLSFDLSQILTRIEPYEEDLVPESIILDGRQGRHQQALRLLTHGLGDYHTAINYCLMGGASIFHPISGSLTPSEASTREDQATLFGYLLTEFLAIEDTNNRLERTSELLERFGGWYDVRRVLDLIPETWSVELVEGFLTSAFRTLLRDRNEAMVVKALSGAENLQVAAEMVEKMRLEGPRVEAEQ